MCAEVLLVNPDNGFENTGPTDDEVGSASVVVSLQRDPAPVNGVLD